MPELTPPSQPLVAVCLLNWNGLDDTRECLRSLRDSTHERQMIFVLDNGSSEDPQALQDEFPEIRLLRSQINLGFAAGHNLLADQALQAGAQFLLLLNNDTLVPPELIASLLAGYAQMTRPGLLAPPEQLLDKPETPQRLGACWLPLSCRVRWVYGNPAELPAVLPVDCVSGCALFVARELVEQTGLFDESFFAYWEDTDLSLRVRALRRQNACITSSSIIHRSGRSTGRAPGFNLAQLYLVCRGQALMVRKHCHGLARLTAPPRLLLSGLWTRLRALVQPAQKALAEAKIAGFRDGWNGRPADRSWLG